MNISGGGEMGRERKEVREGGRERSRKRKREGGREERHFLFPKLMRLESYFGKSSLGYQ